MTKHVFQKQSCGCTVAAVAMVVGKSYEEVASASTRDFDKDGVQLEDWLEYLYENGFTFHRLYRVTHLRGVNKERDTWPPEPFAPIHLCSVVNSIAAHAVVMLANGDVLDPNREGTFRLSDYQATHFVLGLYRAETAEAALTQAQQEIKTLAAEMPRWVPTEEKEPEKAGGYLVTVIQFGKPLVTTDYWVDPVRRWQNYLTVTHWQPLPSPPLERKRNDTH